MSLETNKAFAALLLAGIVAMTSGFIATQLVSPKPLAENVYKVEVAEAAPAAGAAAAAPAALPPVTPLLASATAEAGQAVAKQCTSCHSFEQGGANKVGPNLYGVVGAEHAHVEGFAYSKALAEKKGTPWGYEELNAFLASPKTYAPGTKMTFAGIKKPEDRANLIAYLRSISPNAPAP
ncbi:MAG TPA: cytochrome c family protein [Alphaproteobacteria bacterium]|nr:cytochrome c family protein [Alphaproteobacteria bacterium]